MSKAWRTVTIKVRMTENERRILDELAETRGMSASSLVRSLVLESRLRLLACAGSNPLEPVPMR